MRSCLPRLLSCLYAQPTNALATIATCVEHVKWVSLRTVGLAGIDRCGRYRAPQGIHAARYWFEVIRIDTVPNTAQVVEGQAVGDWPRKQLISQSVRAEFSSFNFEAAIADIADAPHPEPTSIRKMNLSPKALLNILLSAAKDRVTVILPAGIMRLAPPALTARLAAIRDATLVRHRKLTSFVAMQPDGRSSRLPLFYHAMVPIMQTVQPTPPPPVILATAEPTPVIVEPTPCGVR